MLVMVDIADHASFRVVFETSGNFGESCLVKINVVGSVCQDRVVTPDDILFHDEVGEAFEGVYYLFVRR